MNASRNSTWRDCPVLSLWTTITLASTSTPIATNTYRYCRKKLTGLVYGRRLPHASACASLHGHIPPSGKVQVGNLKIACKLVAPDATTKVVIGSGYGRRLRAITVSYACRRAGKICFTV